jgi:hypothetical protein
MRSRRAGQTTRLAVQRYVAHKRRPHPRNGGRHTPCAGCRLCRMRDCGAGELAFRREWPHFIGQIEGEELHVRRCSNTLRRLRRITPRVSLQA